MNQTMKTVEDLGLISSDLIYVNLLPSSTTSIIVKYQPGIQVSCVLSPKEHTINFGNTRRSSKTKIKIDAPTLIMSCSYSNIAHIGAPTFGTYYLNSLNTEKNNRVFAKAFQLANIYQDGRICFGTLKPQSMRIAFNYYWTSNFNAELFRYPHRCRKQVHGYRGHIGCECTDDIEHVACNCPRITFHNHIGCGCTSVTNSVKCRGKCDENTCVCCQAINRVLQEKASQVGKTVSTLRRKKANCIVENEPFPYCGCDWRHKRGCACKKGICNCECKCPCCLETCNCPECKCRCCLETCNCPCRCNPSKMFEHHLKYYCEETKKDEWEDKTAFICGKKYWGSPKGAEGIIISKNRKLLRSIPKKYWRKSYTDEPIIIALANKVDREWHFESGNYKFRIPERLVLAR